MGKFFGVFLINGKLSDFEVLKFSSIPFFLDFGMIFLGCGSKLKIAR